MVGLDVVRFSTFATLSARNRRADAAAACPLLRDQLDLLGGGPRYENNPSETLAPTAICSIAGFSPTKLVDLGDKTPSLYLGERHEG